jgi:hypothetical protein
MAASAVGLLAALFLLILLVRGTSGDQQAQAAPPPPPAPAAAAASEPVATPIERASTTVNIVLFQFTPPAPAAEPAKKEKPRARLQAPVRLEPPGPSQAIAPL